jgi:hypothetical protein
LVEGRRVTVVGIVRRPYPSATDRRFAVVPRSGADVSLGTSDAGAAAGVTARSNGTSGSDGGARGPASRPGTGAASSMSVEGGSPLDVDLAELEAHLGRLVRVGGLVVELVPNGAVLDDGTATGTIALRDAAAELLALVEPGDALNAIGRPERDGISVVLVVRDPAGLGRVGELGEAAPLTQRDAAPPDAVVPNPSLMVLTPAAHAATGPGQPPTAGFGVGAFALVALATAGVIAVRRIRARRLIAARARARLAAIAGPGSEGAASPATDRPGRAADSRTAPFATASPVPSVAHAQPSVDDAA